MKIRLARSASLLGYGELVKALGGEPEGLLARVGMDVDVLQQAAAGADSDSMISADALTRLLDLTAETLNCPCFGLMLSQRQGVSMLGPVGLIMRQSPNFGAALAALQKYLHLHSEAGSFDMQLENKVATISYYPNVSGEDASRQITDLSLGVGCNLVRFYCGKSWRPRGVYVRHRATSDLAPYTMVFHAPISFEQDFNGMTFDAAILESEADAFEPEMQQFIGHYLERLEARRQGNFCDQVELLITAALGNTSCSLKNIALQLGMQPRSLQRQLASEGSSFQAMLDRVRQRLALDYLNSGKRDLAQLSELLGYAELSVFSRAFKAWFGVAPSRYLINR